jgi:hypothetical protein
MPFTHLKLGWLFVLLFFTRRAAANESLTLKRFTRA